MNLTDRDRKIALALVPVLVIVAYWFLLLAPKREEASTAQKDLQEQQDRLAQARAVASAATGDKTDFAADYGEIVRLGKAIPAKVDMPSLLVQLDRAAEGTGIVFTKITQGDRVPVAPPAPPTTTPPADGSAPPPAGTTPAPATPAAPGTAAPPVAAGGAPAASAPGAATEAANTTAATANQQAAAADQSGVDASTSTSAREGGLPVGGGAGAPATGAAAPAPVGLETVPLELEFQGNFFSLADFFHDIKRFVRVANNNVTVNGRLVTIESVDFASDTTIFPRIKATLKATVYLSPAVQGTTAGATPAGPAPTTPAATPAAPAPPGTAPAATPAPAPTAAATPR
jgi:Tfp pilus assembly protein PilO